MNLSPIGKSLGWAAALVVLSPAAASEPAAPQAPAARIVLLPPLVVSAMGPESWRHGSIPGLEILTRASPAQTSWAASGFLNSVAVESKVIPASWFPLLPAPVAAIYDNADLTTTQAGPLRTEPLDFSAPRDAVSWGSVEAQLADLPIAFDGDTVSINSNLYGVDIEGAYYSTIDLVRLDRAIPPLPQWVMAGLVGPCGLFREAWVVTIHREDYSLAGVSDLPRKAAEGPGILWLSAQDTRLIMRLGRRARPSPEEAKLLAEETRLLPLGELFAEGPPPGQDRRRWESEAALLLRWGLLGPGRDSHYEALCDFVNLARRGPVDESVFKECLGFGYAEMEKQLAAYLLEGVGKPSSVDLGADDPDPFPRLSSATPDQVGRILGDWLRMRGEQTRPSDPGLGAAFFHSAGQVFLRAYRADIGDPYARAEALAPQGLRDPALLPVVGLWEYDVGDMAKAREFLEAAERAGCARPRPLLVLAALRYEEARARPAGREGKLSAAQAEAALAPLRPLQAALQVPAVYELMSEIWLHCEGQPSGADVSAVAAGARNYPREGDLTYRAALLCAESGHPRQAAELAAQGLEFARLPQDRRRLERLVPGPAAGP